MEPWQGRNTFVRNLLLPPLQGFTLLPDSTPGLHPGLLPSRPRGAGLEGGGRLATETSLGFRGGYVSWRDWWLLTASSAQVLKHLKTMNVILYVILTKTHECGLRRFRDHARFGWAL
jgi:hypothetical protein